MTAILPEETLSRATEIAQGLCAEVARAFIGQRQLVEQVVAALLAGGHVLIEGMPGLGKTLLAQALARAVGGRFGRIQFTPDLMPADVIGHTVYDPASGQFTTRRGPVFANVLLADEINRAPAKTQSALLEVMQEAQVTLDGVSHRLDAPFVVLATQNPIEQEGTYALPEAQLDRFLFKLLVDFPPEEEELRVLRHATEKRSSDGLRLEEVRTVLAPDALLKLQRIAAHLRIDPAVEAYALRIVRASRSFPGLAFGASTRGAIALLRGARAMALLAGRDFVTPDDIKQLAAPAMRHRIAVLADLAIEGRSADLLVAELVESVEAPRA